MIIIEVYNKVSVKMIYFYKEYEDINTLSYLN